jgi:glycosyltransferase involved in cell wall biosynthesis
MTTDDRRPTTDDQSFAKVGIRPSSSVVRPVSLSVAIIAKDEQRHIAAALDSIAGMAGEVIVLLDSRTSDRTAAISHAHGARVIVEPWRGFAAQRNRALDLCAGDWVLFLDADERVSPELRHELLGIRDWGLGTGETTLPIPNSQSPIAGYWIPRHNQFFGKTLRGGGWYPDRQLRLYKKTLAHWEGPHIHESVKMNSGARVEVLTGDLLHYPARDATYHHRMIGERYAPLGARQMSEAGRCTSPPVMSRA